MEHNPIPQDQYLGLQWKGGRAIITGAEKEGREAFPGVHRPKHYTEGRQYEPWDVIEDWKLNYFAATALKYISRYERKGEPVKDLKKAIEFLKREIVRLEKEKF